MKPVSPRKFIAFFLVWFVCFSAICLAASLMTGCTADQLSRVQSDANMVRSAATQPIVTEVSGGIPYGPVAVSAIGALATIVGLGAGWIKQIQTTSDHKTAIAEIVGDVATWANPTVPFSDKSTAIIASAAGATAASTVAAKTG